MAEISERSRPCGSVKIHRTVPRSDGICGAKIRLKDETCREPPMPNGKCRKHGGLTPAKHSNHKASQNAVKHGFYAKGGSLEKFKAEYRKIRELSDEFKELYRKDSEGRLGSKGLERLIEMAKFALSDADRLGS